jgi:hypothetical protein
MCARCFCKYYFLRNPNFQQINVITRQLGQHLHCSIRCICCGSMLMKSVEIHKRIANRMQQSIKICYSVLICISTCFGRHTTHHQELKPVLAFSGFAYVKRVGRWGCWKLTASGALLVVVWQNTNNNAPAAALLRLNQRLLVQLYAPDDGWRDARNMLSHT